MQVFVPIGDAHEFEEGERIQCWLHARHLQRRIVVTSSFPGLSNPGLNTHVAVGHERYQSQNLVGMDCNAVILGRDGSPRHRAPDSGRTKAQDEDAGRKR